MSIAKIHCTSRSNDSECGAALVELAIILPLLFTIGLLAVDIGRAVNQYSTLAQIARTGARTASQIPELDAATKLSNIGSGGGITPSTSLDTHSVIHTRIQRLLQIEMGEGNLSVNNLAVETDFTPTGSGTPDARREDSIRIQISGTYQSMIPFLNASFFGPLFGIDGIPVNLEVTAPYLF